MKIRLLATILVVFASAQLRAQNTFSPPGAEWWYGFKGGFIYVEGWHHFIYEKDTVVSGFDAKKLIENLYVRYGSSGPFQTYAYNRFLAQRNDSIFVYSDPHWMFRWKLNPTTGQTFQIQLNPANPTTTFTMTVDSVEALNINGFMVNKMWLNGIRDFGLGGGSALVYDWIGPAYADFNYTQCWELYDCYTASLCKYKDDQFPLYTFSAAPCSVISNLKNISFQSALKVFPNPAGDWLEIILPANGPQTARIHVYAATGQWVKTFETAKKEQIEMPTSDLPSGMYFLQLLWGDQQYKGRFVKQ